MFSFGLFLFKIELIMVKIEKERVKKGDRLRHAESFMGLIEKISG